MQQGAHAKEIPICSLPLAELYLELNQLEAAEIKYNSLPQNAFYMGSFGRNCLSKKID